MSLYIFDILLYYYICFYDLSALVGCWSSVSIRRIIYKFLNVCPFDYTAGKVERSLTGSTTQTVTPTDRPKSVRNHYVIEVFVAYYVVTLLFGFFCEWRGVCHRTGSDIFLFLLHLSQISSFFSYIDKISKGHIRSLGERRICSSLELLFWEWGCLYSSYHITIWKWFLYKILWRK